MLRGDLRGRLALTIAMVGCLLVAAPASAHVERASYWPDPQPDCSISPCAGGQVPTPRTLDSALSEANTKVVCQPDSMTRLAQSINAAQSTGYLVRPSQPRQKISGADGRALTDLNRKLSKRCQFDSIQAAVNASGNNGRVVIMPGLYTEPASRAAPTYDQSCAQYGTTNDHGQTGALSYQWQFHCPNDQNLIAVMGREPNGAPPDPPLENRQGIPDLGPCVRCNVQIEGSVCLRTTSRSTRAAWPPETARRSIPPRTSASGPTARTAS